MRKIAEIQIKKAMKFTWAEGENIRTLVSIDPARRELYLAWRRVEAEYSKAAWMEVAGAITDSVAFDMESIRIKWEKGDFYMLYALKGELFLSGLVRGTITIPTSRGCNTELDQAVETLLEEGNRYLRGERAQMSLFEAEEKTKQEAKQ